MLLALAVYLTTSATCLFVLAVLDFFRIVPGLDAATAAGQQPGSFPFWFTCSAASLDHSSLFRRAPVRTWPQVVDAPVLPMCFTLRTSPVPLTGLTARALRLDWCQRPKADLR
jgi:hypothetical protein